MKINRNLLTALFIALFYVTSAQSPLTHSIFPSRYVGSPVGSQVITGEASLPPCTDSSFWTVNGTGGIEECVLSNGTVTTTNFYSNTPGYSLAVCNLNGIAASPTFYTIGLSSDSVLYYDGTKWLTGNGRCEQLFNASGYGNYLYFMKNINGTYLNSIIRYNGNTFDTILNGGNTTFSCADIATDAVGNIWCLRNDSASALFIDVISPQGMLLKRFNASLNCESAYGCFLLNEVLYIGLGQFNPVHPYSLIPFSFVGNSAIQGAPITMSFIEYLDLASCRPGNPLHLTTAVTSPDADEMSLIKIFPNPVIQSGAVTIKSNTVVNSVLLRDLSGRVVMQLQTANHKEITFSTQNFAPGIYLIELSIEKNELPIIRKLIIE